MKNFFTMLLIVQGLVLFSQNKPKLIYIADPFCSWCYGFQMEMDQVLEKYKDQFEIEMLVGGMGTDQKKPIDQEFKESLKDHWEQVKEETGQTFDAKILNTKGLVYNSEPLCRAIVTVKSIDSTKALKTHKTLQKAFYAQNKNVTQLQEIKKCVFDLGVDTTVFVQKYNTPEMKKKTQEEFDRVEKNGVTGFPVLIFSTDKKSVLITDGYAKFKIIEKKLNKELGKK